MSQESDHRLGHAVGQASTPGSRAAQEDRIKTVRVGETLLVALADGVGGRPGGGDAAGAAVEAALGVLADPDAGRSFSDRLSAALQAADDSVARLSVDGLPSPGSTLLLAAFSGTSLEFVSVGDSHLLRFRDGELHFLTARQQKRVESEVLALLSGKAEDWRRTAGIGRPRALTMAIMGEHLFKPGFEQREVLNGDIYLLATDGIETISFDALMRAVPELARRLNTPNDIAERIIGGVREMRVSGQDNATLGVVISLASGARSDGNARTVLGSARARVFTDNLGEET